MSKPSPPSLPNLPWLLDRRRAGHPWLDALASLEQSPQAGAPALAANWRMDGRVDEVREAQLQASGCFSSASFDKAVGDYFVQQQCRPAWRAPRAGYADAANDGNRISSERRPVANHRLLHLLSVNRVLQRLLRRNHAGRADFLLALLEFMGAPLPPYGNPEQIDRFADSLAERLQAQGPEAIRRFAEAVSDALGDSEPLWWAAFAHEVDSHLQGEDWSGAARCLGLGHLPAGDWLIAWRYSPDLAGPLYRPSVAEAGANGFHFPSHPAAACGVTMPLARGLPALRELIHPPLKGDASRESCTGRLGRIAQPLALVDGHPAFNRWLKRRRQEHRDTLAADSAAQAWLQRHRSRP